jgi:purine-cytosine permease-like protein
MKNWNWNQILTLPGGLLFIAGIIGFCSTFWGYAIPHYVKPVSVIVGVIGLGMAIVGTNWKAK